MSTSWRVGARLRRLRTEQGLTQAAFAASLEVSASYYNQLEHDHRALTGTVLARLVTVYGVDASRFTSDEAGRTAAELRELLSARGSRVDAVELAAVLRHAPGLVDSLVRAARESATTAAPASPHEQVRDFFYARRNHIAPLDRAAEKLTAHWDLTPGRMADGLTRVLHAQHGVSVVEADDSVRRRYDPQARTLALPRSLADGARAFRIATQIGLLHQADRLDDLVAADPELGAEAAGLARIGLAQYYAGAVLLPYTQFLRAATESRYDIDLLGDRFGVGFETVCHRLSTLQRPGARGVPFFLVRTDRAGNISKRQSATTFHFSRTGGSCPLWVVHEAFDTPGRVRRQVSRMPDGRAYLWVARTVGGRSTAFRSPRAEFAVGLGCDLRQARHLVYGDGLDLSSTAAATPIGPGCRACDRDNCVQRAFPADGRPVIADPNLSGTPYH